VRDEALTGEPAGQPLSRESNKLVQGAKLEPNARWAASVNLQIFLRQSQFH
jgi:hypothetical protein